MRFKPISFFILLVPLILLAGCQAPGGGPTGDGGGAIPSVRAGVVIQKFYPEEKKVFSGDTVTLTLEVSNIGEEDATNVKAKLTPPGTDWSIVSGKEEIDLGNLEKSQPQYGIPGGFATYSWVLQVPEKESGVKTAYVKINYHYKTRARAKVVTYSFDYYKMKITKGEKINESAIENLDVSLGPIEVTIKKPGEETQKLPFLFRTSGDTGTLVIYVSNVGGGYVYLHDESDRKVRVTAKVNGETCINNEEKELPPISAKSFVCNFHLPQTDSIIKVPIEIEVDYNYILEGQTSIPVTKAIE